MVIFMNYKLWEYGCRTKLHCWDITEWQDSKDMSGIEGAHVWHFHNIANMLMTQESTKKDSQVPVMGNNSYMESKKH